MLLGVTYEHSLLTWSPLPVLEMRLRLGRRYRERRKVKHAESERASSGWKGQTKGRVDKGREAINPAQMALL